MNINITLDQDLVKAAAWSKTIGKQLPFATSLALNNTAFDVRKSLNDGTRGVFHSPVRFTQTAFLVQKSKKRELIALVFAQDKQGKDRARYLRFGIAGGQRPQKGMDVFFERGVPNDGTIPNGAYFMPTSLVKINSAGNVTQATLKRITKGLNSEPRGGFFIGTPRGGNRAPGIYRRSRAKLQPYFIATTNKPDYTERFDIESIGTKVVDRRFNQHFQAALKRALATAR
jgi:hypothetical protein